MNIYVIPINKKRHTRVHNSASAKIRDEKVYEMY